ncbi:MAG: SAM-dependent methyltransferase [Candidatus Omnitrophica bacterium]|nr:SAM-dependent methyltransferase [Candidatus Omnitrophota bacterium]
MNKAETYKRMPSSFRDPSGFLFHLNGEIYRQINICYKKNYDYLMNSGLYESLTAAGLLIPHKEVDIDFLNNEKAYKIIMPERIPFISYPYEWCFSQFKDAALTTLKIQKKALEFDLSLKDCSAYNIQFRDGKPIFIDTLSFERYREGQPWVAYRQFCQHFLAPLAIMCYTDIRLSHLLRIYLDGIPLDLASRLLPFCSRFSFFIFSHIHMHAASQGYFADRRLHAARYKTNRLALLGIIDNLESAIQKLKWRSPRTGWSDYYNETSYSQEAQNHKKKVIDQFLNKLNPKTVWDFGANLGVFSRISSSRGIETVSFDIDSSAVEKNYLECKNKNETRNFPLLLDITNPSPGIGWENQERNSLIERGPADIALALALIHHLAISNNLPFNKIASFFSRVCRLLIIEFIPKSDYQAQKLLSTREDIFSDYTQQIFEREFEQYFIMRDSVPLRDSKRILYLMEKRRVQTR